MILFLSGRIVVHICAASPAALLVTFRGFCHSFQANDEIALSLKLRIIFYVSVSI